MENGAEEPEQSETLAEIGNSADLEDATTTTCLEGKEVHHAVEDVLNEQKLHSSGEQLTVADEDTSRNVSDSMADGNENESTISSELTMDVVRNAPEEESPESSGPIVLESNSSEDLSTSHRELSRESEKHEESPTLHEEFREENLGKNELPTQSVSAQNSPVKEDGNVELPSTNDELTTKEKAAVTILSAERDKGIIEPVPAHEEHAQEEGVALEGPSTTASATSVAVEEDDNPIASLSASEVPRTEDTQTDNLAATPATVEETGVEDKALEPEEVFPKDSNEESTKSGTVVEDEARSSTKNDQGDVGVEITELEPATADAELLKGENLIDEVPSSTKSTVTPLEVDSAPLDHQGSTNESVLDEPPSTVESAEATTVEDEKNVAGVATDALERDEDLDSAAPPVDPMPDELELSRESTEALAEEAEKVNHDKDFKSAASTEDKEPDEVGSTALSTEVTLVEDAKNDEDLDSAAPNEEQNPDEFGSTPEFTEATPVGDASTLNHNKDFEPVTSNDDTKAEGLVPASESIEDAPVEDVEQAEAVEDFLKEESGAEETPSGTELAETSPAIEDEATEVPTSHEELVKETQTDEEPPTAQVVEGPRIDSADKELNQDSNLVDETMVATESAAANPAIEDENMESFTPSEELPKSVTTEHVDTAGGATLVPDSDGATPMHTKGADNVTADVLNEENLAGETTASESAIEEKDVEAPTPTEEFADKKLLDEFSSAGNPASTPHEGLPNEETRDEVAQIPDSDKAPVVEDDTDAELLKGDEGIIEEDNAADEMSLISDSSDATFVLENEDLESSKNLEASTSEEDLAREVSMTDELSRGLESGNTTSVEESKPAGVVEADKSVNEDIDSIPTLEDVEASISQELGKEETVDEVSQSPETGNVIPLEDARDGEVVIGEKSEHLAEEMPLNTADGIPAAEDQNVEATTSHEELAKEVTTTEVDEEYGDVTLLDDTKDEEAVITDDGLIKEDSVAGDTLVNTDSAIAASSVEDKDFEIPTTHEELAKDDDAVPDESVVTSESCGVTSGVEDEVLKASIPDEEPAMEGAIDEVAPTPEFGESTVVEDAVDAEPVIRDKEVNNEYGVDEAALIKTSEDDISVPENKDVDDLHQSELVKEETADDGAQPLGSVCAALIEDTKVEEAVTLDEDVANEQSDVHEEALTTDSAEAIPAGEDTDVKAPTCHEGTVDDEFGSPELVTGKREISKEESQAEEAPLAADAEDISYVAEDEGVDVAPPHDEVVEEDSKDQGAQSPESFDSSVVDDSKDGESVAGEREVSTEESLAEDLTLAAAAVDASHVVDKIVDVPTPHEVAEEETTDEATQSPESGDNPIVEDAKGAEHVTVNEDVNKGPSTTEDAEANLTTDSAEKSPLVEEENVQAPTSSEERVMEKTVDDVSQYPESVEAAPFVDGKDGEPTGAEGLIREKDLADEIPSTIDSLNADPVAEDEVVEPPTPQEELGKETTVTRDLDKAIPVENAGPLTKAVDVSVEQSTTEEDLTTDSAETTNAVEEAVVEVPLPVEEVAKEETEPYESAIAPEALEVSPVMEDADAESVMPASVKKEVDVPEVHEELAQEDAVTQESSSAPESPVVTLEEYEGVEPEIGKEEFTEDKSLAEDKTLEIDSSEPITAIEAKEEESPTPHQEPDGINNLTEEVTSTSDITEGAAIEGDADAELSKEKSAPDGVSSATDSAEATPVIEDEAVESSTQVQLSRELVVADEVPSDLPAQAAVIETEKHVEPADVNEDLIKSEVAPINDEVTTKEREANATDSASEPAEIVDKHVVTTESPEELQRTSLRTNIDDQINGNPKDAVQPLVREDGTKEAIDHTFSSANGDKVEERETLLEKTPNLALTGERLASDGDDILERNFESDDPAITADLEGDTIDAQGHEAQFVNSVHSSQSGVLTTSGSKAIQIHETDAGFLQEPLEKVQNVAQDSEEDTTSVPLSTHTTDLSSSWVSVSPIESAEVQAASSGSRMHLSQKSESRRPYDELTYAGDDWRIVSEQEVSALGVSNSKTNDVDTGSSGIKFPFSIVLWCSQSLFGGARKLRMD